MYIWKDYSPINENLLHGYRFKKINLLICKLWFAYVLTSDYTGSEKYFKLRSVELAWK